MKLGEMKAKLYRKVAAYAATHPGETYTNVGRRFGISETQARRVAGAHTDLAPRRPGRKPSSR